ncbi:MAG: hypothetical protein AMXMBFR13_45850 [Phycisphaerae bacterium]|jgi:uncharacterized protein (TIGR04255 family)
MQDPSHDSLRTGGAGRRIRLDFGNLPLVEAAVRVSLESPIPLRFATINRVKERLASEFSTLEEPTQFEIPPGLPGPLPPFHPGQIPGAVYGGNPQGLTVTLQNQVIVARWLKEATQNGREYPRFQSLSSVLWKSTEAIESTLDQELPRIIVANVSYVNFLKVPHTAPVLSHYFSEAAHVKAALGAQQVLRVGASWREHDAIDLRFELAQVTAEVGDETIEGYRLTTAAGTRLTERDNPQQSLDNVHTKLQVFFSTLISRRAKEEWQLREVPLE